MTTHFGNGAMTTGVRGARQFTGVASVWHVLVDVSESERERECVCVCVCVCCEEDAGSYHQPHVRWQTKTRTTARMVVAAVSERFVRRQQRNLHVQTKSKGRARASDCS